jgi:hypothetical protein
MRLLTAFREKVTKLKSSSRRVFPCPPGFDDDLSRPDAFQQTVDHGIALCARVTEAQPAARTKTLAWQYPPAGLRVPRKRWTE